MKKRLPTSDQPPHDSQSSISNSALADFLGRLAALHASPMFGNPALATALRELAESVRRRSPSDIGDNRLSDEGRSKQPTADLELLRALDHESIRRFISDETKSKAELIDLASARFSIPMSQLKRMKVADVRQTINSALLHESSIDILSEEATRDGKNRSS